MIAQNLTGSILTTLALYWRSAVAGDAAFQLPWSYDQHSTPVRLAARQHRRMGSSPGGAAVNGSDGAKMGRIIHFGGVMRALQIYCLWLAAVAGDTPDARHDSAAAVGQQGDLVSAA